MAIFKKEKKVIERILKHLDIAEECLKTSLRAIESFLQDDTGQAKIRARNSRSLESEADLVRHDIRDKLYSGAYLPLLREDIYKLIESIDKVSNASETSCDFFLNQRPKIPDEIKPNAIAVQRLIDAGAIIFGKTKDQAEYWCEFFLVSSTN